MLSKRKLSFGLFTLTIVSLVVLVSVSGTPRGGTREEQDACIDCHSPTHEDYLIIKTVSYDIPSTITDTPSNVKLEIDISANNCDYCAGHSPYFESKVTVEAISTNGYVAFDNSPRIYNNQIPPLHDNITFTATGQGNGADTITLKATMDPLSTASTCSSAKTVSVSESGSVDVTANVAPSLSSGQVSPTSGDTETDFTYKVTCTDTGGQVPTYVKVNIDGVYHDMGALDGTADTLTTGEVYAVVLSGKDIGVGTTHEFSFSAYDGTHNGIGDISSHTGPTVGQGDRLPTVTITNPSSGTYGGPLKIKGTAEDMDTGQDITKVEVSLNDGTWQTATGTASWSLDVDLYSYDNGPMTIKARSSNGVELSDIVQVDITVDNDLQNTPPVVKFDLEDDDVVEPIFTLTGTIVDPDLPNQGIKVYAGLDTNPATQAEFKESGGKYVWSLDLDLTSQPEGYIDIYAKAEDPYATSTIEKLTVKLDKPNEAPAITINPVAGKVSGNTRFSGQVSDPNSGDLLEVEVSFDNNKWFSAKLNENRWTYDYDVSNLQSGENTIYAKVFDGYVETQASAKFEVLGPPVIMDFGPASPVSMSTGQSVIFWAQFSGVTKDDVEAKWLLDGSPKAGSIDGDKAKLDMSFDLEGNYVLTVTLTNTQGDSLSVTNDWIINVAAKVDVEPKGDTRIEAKVGDSVDLEFELVAGEVESVTWMVDDAQTSSDQKFTFKPQKAGEYRISCVVTDGSGSTDSFFYDVIVTEDETGGSSAGSASGASSVFLLVGILAAIIVVGVVVVIIVVLVSKKKKKPGAPEAHHSSKHKSFEKPPEESQQNQQTPQQPHQTHGSTPQQQLQQNQNTQYKAYPGQQQQPNQNTYRPN
jgi:hypothetical protein